MHAEDNGLAVDFTVTTPGRPLIRPYRHPSDREAWPHSAGEPGATGDRERQAGAAPAGPQEGRKEAPQPRRDLSGKRTPAEPSRRATGPGFARPDPSSAEATARRDQLGHRARLDLSEPCFQQPRV